MKIFLCYFFIIPVLWLHIEGRYERHNQQCGGMNGADTKWSLDLKPNNTYILSITTKTTDYLQKPKSRYLAGSWKSEADTLRLYQWNNESRTLTFYRQEQKLVFQKRKLFVEEVDLLYLDYLQKTEK